MRPEHDFKLLKKLSLNQKLIMIEFFKFMFYFFMAIVMIVIAILAAPTMWEQATTDKAQHPHSGATPECPTWDTTLEEGMERAELMRQFRD